MTLFANVGKFIITCVKKRTQRSHPKFGQKTFVTMYSAKSLDLPCS